MVCSRLLVVVLVLLQAGLSARAHEHSGHAGLGAAHPTAPHTHAHDLLDLLDLFHPDNPAPADGGDCGGGDHDADVIYLTVASPAPPPTADGAVGSDTVPAPPGLALVPAAAPTLLPTGLPPPTAGPARPLYLTYCSLRN